MAERVWITGVSCISCFGVGRQAFDEAIRSGTSGIAPIATFDTATCHSHSAAMIREFDPTAFMSPLKLRRIDAVGRLAVAGAHLLFDDAACRPDAEGADHIGVALGTMTAGLDSLVEYLGGLTDHGPTGVPAILFSNTVSNAPASLCAIEFGLRGPNVTFNQREASSFGALLFSVAAIRHGRASAMVTGGADRLEETFFKVHDRFRSLSPMPHAAHTTIEAARPFDRERNGFILGEGGFLLLLESAAAAEARGARVYGEVLGIGATASKTQMNRWPEDHAGLVNAMKQALNDAKLGPADISAVIGTSNGSPVLDRLEAAAIRQLFDDAVPVASIKGALGESGAAGAAAVTAGLSSIASGALMPTAGLCHSDDRLQIRVSRGAQPVEGDTFLVNSVASGGTNYSVVVRVRRPS